MVSWLKQLQSHVKSSELTERGRAAQAAPENRNRLWVITMWSLCDICSAPYHQKYACCQNQHSIEDVDHPSAGAAGVREWLTRSVLDGNSIAACRSIIIRPGLSIFTTQQYHYSNISRRPASVLQNRSDTDFLMFWLRWSLDQPSSILRRRPSARSARRREPSVSVIQSSAVLVMMQCTT